MPSGFVLIADRAHARRAGNRRDVQPRLDATLQRIRTLHGVAWHAPLEAAGGTDTLSGVLRGPTRAFDIAWAVNLAIWPERFRFVLGQGEIDIRGRAHHTTSANGPTEPRTAAALERAREDDLPFALALPGIDPAQAATVEALARLHDAVVADWSARTAEFVRAYDELGRQRDVAARLDVSQQAVSKALRRARADELEGARRAIASWLAAAEASLTP